MGQEDITQYLRSLKAVRERTSLLVAHPDKLQSFDVHIDNVEKVADLIVTLIKRDYASIGDIPPHTRWRHFDVGGKKRITELMGKWKAEGVEQNEVVYRLIDLFLVSVLLDAGAGNVWKYVPKDEPEAVYNRSEGLALASLDMFVAGGFSSSAAHPCRVDSVKLTALTVNEVATGFQVSDSNPLSGLEGRTGLLNRLGQVLQDCPRFFESESGVRRPANMASFLLHHASTQQVEGKHQVRIETLWEVIMDGISGIWPPTRSKIGSVSLGDVWPCKALHAIHNNSSETGSQFIAFHKLSQWLTYSLMEPLQLLGIEFLGAELLTGLAEYRNGGLLVDMNVISLKDSALQACTKTKDGVPLFEVHEDTVVEWRGLTVAMLDVIAQKVRGKLNVDEKTLPLAKVLEAGECLSVLWWVLMESLML
jgi:hypothetical protein